jgi:tRNA threonylcarbamoyladenosine biosynthesis protein TsaE
MQYSEADVEKVAQRLLTEFKRNDEEATVVGLEGDLGAGKTILTKAIAKELGVLETVVSPTFVIAKYYDATDHFTKLVHIDAYRIESETELQPLHWESILSQPNTLVIIEWPERISDSLPASTHRYKIEHEGDLRRIITL